MRNRWSKIEFYGLVGKQPDSPTAVSFRNFRTGQRYESRFKSSIEYDFARRLFSLFTIQGGIKAFFNKPLLDVFDCTGCDPKSCRRVGDTP